MSILLDTLIELQNNNVNIIDKYNERNSKLKNTIISLSPPLYISNISNSIQCFTNFIPRAPPLENYSINKLILTNVNYIENDLILLSSQWTGWYSIVADDANFVIQKIPFGHFDLKYSIYGSSISGPISFIINVQSSGYVSILFIILFINLF